MVRSCRTPSPCRNLRPLGETRSAEPGGWKCRLTPREVDDAAECGCPRCAGAGVPPSPRTVAADGTAPGDVQDHLASASHRSSLGTVRAPRSGRFKGWTIHRAVPQLIGPVTPGKIPGHLPSCDIPLRKGQPRGPSRPQTTLRGALYRALRGRFRLCPAACRPP